MAGVAARYGETGASPYLLPLSVDGLIVVASICLVELGGRISSLETANAPAQPAATPAGPTAGSPRRAASGQPTASSGPAGEAGAPDLPEFASEPSIPGLIPTPAVGAVGHRRRAAMDPRARTAKKERRSPAETVALANRIKAERPSLTEAEVAAELGISASHWRTVRRAAAAGDHTLAA
jgi:hypothetical protein